MGRREGGGGIWRPPAEEGRSVVKSEAGERLQQGLRSSLDRLRSVDLNDLDSAWEATVEVLGWLYRCEEAEKATGKDAYFAERAASDDGRTLAALTWFRSLIDHHQAEVKRSVLTPVTWNGEQVTWRGDAVAWSEDRPGWPPLLSLPLKVDQHGYERHQLYEELVECEGLRPPLDRAASWLIAR